MSAAPPPETAADAALIVLTTVADVATAADIARALVEESLAACVNMLPGVRSIYAFEGRLCDDAEVLCVIKTRAALFPRLRDRLAALHPYQVPEIVAVPVSAVAPPYLAWLLAATAAR